MPTLLGLDLPQEVDAKHSVPEKYVATRTAVCGECGDVRRLQAIKLISIRGPQQPVVSCVLLAR